MNAVAQVGLRSAREAEGKPMTCPPRDLALDALKGLAIVGVLFAHMSFSSRLSPATLARVGAIQAWFGWCVAAFFFGAGRLTRFEQLPANAWREYVLKRARRLLVPCLAFSLTYKFCLVALNCFLGIGEPRLVPKSAMQWLGFVLIPVGPQFYFLPYLFVISVASVGGLMVAKDMRLLMWCTLAAVASFYAFVPTLTLTYGATPVLIPGFVLSFWLGLACRQLRCEQYGWWAAVFSLVLVGCWVRHTFSYAQFVAPTGLYWILTHTPRNAPLAYLGRESGSIYVWHDPLLLPACSILLVGLIQNQALQVAAIIGSGIAASILVAGLVGRTKWLSYFHF